MNNNTPDPSVCQTIVSDLLDLYLDCESFGYDGEFEAAVGVVLKRHGVQHGEPPPYIPPPKLIWAQVDDWPDELVEKTLSSTFIGRCFSVGHAMIRMTEHLRKSYLPWAQIEVALGPYSAVTLEDGTYPTGLLLIRTHAGDLKTIAQLAITEQERKLIALAKQHAIDTWPCP